MIKELADFKDVALVSGIGRLCKACKSTPAKRASRSQAASEKYMTPNLQKLNAPNCPSCSGFMKLRFRRRDGNPFWGCSKFPRCKGTKNIQSTS